MQLKRKLSKYNKAMRVVDAIFSLSRGDGPIYRVGHKKTSKFQNAII